MPARKQNTRTSIQYTLRSIPPDVDRWLRRRADEESRSLNEMVIRVLADAARGRTSPRRHRDLSWLVGALGPDPELDQALKDQRRIDEDMWR